MQDNSISIGARMGWQKLGRGHSGEDDGGTFIKEGLKLCPKCKAAFAAFRKAGYIGTPPKACDTCVEKLKNRYSL